MVMFTFSIFSPEIPFLGNLVPKFKVVSLKLKPGTKSNSDIQNSMVLFTFFALDREYTFWADLVQKIKTVSLSWNLVPRLVRICKI